MRFVKAATTLCVAFILDVYARVIIGWQIATHMRTDLVIDALEMAAWRRKPAGGCVHHSDAGSQYTSIRYTDRLAIAGLAASVGTVGEPAVWRRFGRGGNCSIRWVWRSGWRWPVKMLPSWLERAGSPL